eukprot:859192-Prymnesium_polylepis.2
MVTRRPRLAAVMPSASSPRESMSSQFCGARGGGGGGAVTNERRACAYRATGRRSDCSGPVRPSPRTCPHAGNMGRAPSPSAPEKHGSRALPRCAGVRAHASARRTWATNA